eukprot:Opistho-2@45459
MAPPPRQPPPGRSFASTLTFSIECDFEEPSPAPCLQQIPPKTPKSPMHTRFPSGFNGAGSAVARSIVAGARHPYSVGTRTIQNYDEKKGAHGNGGACVHGGGTASTSRGHAASGRPGSSIRARQHNAADDAASDVDAPCTKCNECGGCKHVSSEGNEDELLATHVLDASGIPVLPISPGDENEDIRKYRSEKSRRALSAPQVASAVNSIRFPASPGIQSYNTYKQLPILLPPLRRRAVSRAAEHEEVSDHSDTESAHTSGRRVPSRGTDCADDDNDDAQSEASVMPAFCPYGSVFPTQVPETKGARWIQRFRFKQHRLKSQRCRTKLEEKSGNNDSHTIEDLVRSL